MGKLAPIRPSGPMLSVEKAAQMLAQCEDLGDCKKIRDQAAAMSAYARAQRASIAIINSGTKIKLLAMARIGELTAGMEGTGKPGGDQRAKSKPRTLKSDQLEAAGLTKQEASRCEKVAAEQKEIAAYVDACTAGGQLASEDGFRRQHITKTHTSQAEHDGDSWGTPEHIIECARAAMGSIDCDPATNARAQRAVGAEIYYTKSDNGLKHEWHGNIWLNPPYSMPAVSEFADAVVEEYESGRVKQAIVLVNNATDAAWCHGLLERYPACFTKGRIRFVDHKGKGSSSPMQGQVIFYLGKDVQRFANAFAEVGVVVAKI